MANPITWRSVTAPSTSSDLAIALTGVRQGGMGLADRAAKAASNMDAEQLNAALNQISQLNQVGQAQEAIDNNFVDGLNLRTERQRLAARNALGTQVDNNRNSVLNAQRFDDTQLNRAERDTIGQYQSALAEGRLDEAETLLGSLSERTQGTLAGDLASERTRVNQRNFLNDAFNQIQQIPALNATADALRKQYPIYADDIVVENGQLKARDGGALNQELLDGLVQRDMPNAVTSAMSPDQLRLNLLQKGANADISPQQILSLQGLLGNVFSADPVMSRERTVAEQQRQTDLALNEIDLEERLALPTDPRLTPLEGVNKEDIYAEFKPLTEKTSGFFNWGKGDFEAFTKAADAEVTKGWKDSRGRKREYDPRVIQLALQGTSAIRRAENDGNLGDTGFTGLFTGDNLDPTEFKTLLDTIQMQYNANQAIDASKTEARRQAARNRIKLGG